MRDYTGLIHQSGITATTYNIIHAACDCARGKRGPHNMVAVLCQTLPGLPRAARPSGRFAEGKTQRETKLNSHDNL